MGKKMADDVLKIFAEGRVDAKSLSGFMSEPSDVLVPRRIAPDVHSFNHYVDYLDGLKAVYEQTGGNVSVNGTTVKSIQQVATDASFLAANTINAVVDGIAIDANLVNDALIKTVPVLGGVARTQRAVNAEQVSVKSYGAIGDGTLHTVSEWTVIGSAVYYPNLDAIKADYPHVTSLSDSIDWAATQQCVNIAPKVYAPKGKYILSRTVKTPHRTTPRSVGTLAAGVHIYGDGVQTAFTRSDEGECTRIFNTEGTSTTQASDTANSLEACFSVHCPYTNITNMTLQSSRLGIYMGQDFTQPFSSLSSSTYSMFTNLTINRCGTGILGLAAGGNHYIGLNNVNFYGCQIDYHLRSSFWWKITQARGDANNNRHSFIKVRSDSSRVGYWNECGDTNTFHSWHAENLSSTTTNTPYPVPHHLPTDLPKGSCAFIFTGSNQLNKMTGCHAEACEWSLYNNGYRNTFIDNGMKPSLCTFIQTPHYWIDTFAQWGGGITSFDDGIFTLSSKYTDPNAIYIGVNGRSRTRFITHDIIHNPSTSLKGSSTLKYQVELGVIAANTPTSMALWADGDANSCASIDVTVVGRCDVAGSISVFSTKAIAIGHRGSIKTISRLGLTKTHSSRATDNNFMDAVEANHIAVTLEKGGSTMRDLLLKITCPFDLSGATVFIKQYIQKI